MSRGSQASFYRFQSKQEALARCNGNENGHLCCFCLVQLWLAILASSSTPTLLWLSICTSSSPPHALSVSLSSPSHLLSCTPLLPFFPYASFPPEAHFRWREFIVVSLAPPKPLLFQGELPLLLLPHCLCNLTAQHRMWLVTGAIYRCAQVHWSSLSTFTSWTPVLSPTLCPTAMMGALWAHVLWKPI